jgi:CDP-alcohol phosphatidyltransferase
MTTSYLYDYVTKNWYATLTRRIWPTWVHPNYITLLGAVLALLSGIARSYNWYGWATILFTLYYLCDCMDGEQARQTNQCSRFGAWLDHMVDGTVANYVGYTTLATVLFGLQQNGNDLHHDGAEFVLYRSGLHAWSCVWLAPHVICHFNGGHLSYGSKWFGIEEASILVALTLAAKWYWSSTSAPNNTNNSGGLLSVPELYLEILVHALTYLSIGYVGISVTYYSSSSFSSDTDLMDRPVTAQPTATTKAPPPPQQQGGGLLPLLLEKRKYVLLWFYLVFWELGRGLIVASTTTSSSASTTTATVTSMNSSGLALWWICWTGLIGATIWQP